MTLRSGQAPLGALLHMRQNFVLNKTWFSEYFTIYGVNWTPNKIEYYFNGALVHVKTTHIPQLPMPVFLNLAVGGFYDGPPNAQTVFPCSFEIDYFRVYENLNGK